MANALVLIQKWSKAKEVLTILWYPLIVPQVYSSPVVYIACLHWCCRTFHFCLEVHNAIFQACHDMASPFLVGLTDHIYSCYNGGSLLWWPDLCTGLSYVGRHSSALVAAVPLMNTWASTQHCVYYVIRWYAFHSNCITLLVAIYA